MCYNERCPRPGQDTGTSNRPFGWLSTGIGRTILHPLRPPTQLSLMEEFMGTPSRCPKCGYMEEKNLSYKTSENHCWNCTSRWRPDYIGRQYREWILRRDNYECVACGSEDRITPDHIIPKSHGGRSTPDNLQTLCCSCNSKKGAAILMAKAHSKRISEMPLCIYPSILRDCGGNFLAASIVTELASRPGIPWSEPKWHKLSVRDVSERYFCTSEAVTHALAIINQVSSRCLARDL